jgi:hypothetical protein
MFKRLISLILLAVFVAGCSSTGSSTPATGEILPLIKVDDQHLQFTTSASDSPVDYSIPAGKGFLLDATGYQFIIPNTVAVQPPNVIRLMVDDNQEYFINWIDGQAQYKVTIDTLKPLAGARILTGFTSGQQIVVAIGRTIGDQFVVYWAGIANIY